MLETAAPGEEWRAYLDAKDVAAATCSQMAVRGLNQTDGTNTHSNPYVVGFSKQMQHTFSSTAAELGSSGCDDAT
jgi:hypothetical protein